MFIFFVVAIGVLRWPLLATFLLPPLVMLVMLVEAPIYLAVTARRLHDAGHSARWLLIYAAIILGWARIVWLGVEFAKRGNEGMAMDTALGATFILAFLSSAWSLATLASGITLLVLCSARGTNGPNQYGPDPLVQSSDGGG